MSDYSEEAATSNTNILRKKKGGQEESTIDIEKTHLPGAQVTLHFTSSTFFRVRIIPPYWHPSMSNPITEQEERTAKRRRTVSTYQEVPLGEVETPDRTEVAESQTPPSTLFLGYTSSFNEHPTPEEATEDITTSEIPEMKKLVLCTTAQLKEYSRVHCNGRIGGSRAQIISRLTGLSLKEAQEALGAVTITEKKGLTDNDGFGEMKMKMSRAEVATFSKKIQAEPEMKRMCQLWEAMRVAEAVRGTLHDRLTHGTRKYGQLFLGSCSPDVWRWLMVRDELLAEAYQMSETVMFDGEPKKIITCCYRFVLDEKRANCGLPKFGTEETWWLRCVTLEGKPEIVLYASAIVLTVRNTSAIYVEDPFNKTSVSFTLVHFCVGGNYDMTDEMEKF
ncbi:hypothetical protein PROFUN_06540 [Planoprotostelium fungivorum]|uniref:Uncharacterized protein n=1 Tax=Planoprotostelium fungivorum TaxID=1890364 RepID=A0A2P6NP37_9EUKA|nr:hypothetical protein PROFUN_06540 [Planoprotostelium fungivorum]